MAIWVVFAVMTAAAVLAVLWPLSRARADAVSVNEDAQFYRDQVAEIERDRERGLLSPVEAEAAKAEAARFRGERQDLEEMIGNLVDNACKWAAGRVAISGEVARDGERARLVLRVEDDGPGLPEEARGTLKRGRRLDESKPGSGLGLSIVSDLAALYRGSLDLSRSPLGGLAAVLDLPGDAA